MAAKRYEFEGKSLTIYEISRLYPAYGAHAVRYRVEHGAKCLEDFRRIDSEANAKMAERRAKGRAAWSRFHG